MTSRPSLVIISGPPASGKTTLARSLSRELGMPLFAKDSIKERLADALGPVAHDHASAIGLAAILTLYDLGREVLEAGQPVMLESFFHHGRSEMDLSPLIQIAHPILIHCLADQNTIRRRYIDRANRHAVHGDHLRLEDLDAYFANGVTDPLDLPIPRLMISTEQRFPDPVEIAAQIRAMLGMPPQQSMGRTP